MTIANYGQLKSTIADFLNRDDLAAVIPAFITMGEAMINRQLRHWRMEKGALTTFNEGRELLPSDWLQTIRVELVNGGPLRQVSQAEMARLQANGDTGEPRFFCHSAGQLEFWPVPSDSSGRIVYFAKSPAMVNDDDTNWTLLEAPDLYVYAALVHSAPYLKDDPRLAVWQGMYAEILAAMNGESDMARHSGPLAMGWR